MIPTNEGVLVDSCDPLWALLADFRSWERIKRETGRNLNRTMCPTYIQITSEETYPDYLEVHHLVQEASKRIHEGDCSNPRGH
jgi:hypothetical protein